LKYTSGATQTEPRTHHWWCVWVAPEVYFNNDLVYKRD